MEILGRIIPIWLVALVCFAAGTSSGTYVTYEIYSGKIAKLQRDALQARNDAVDEARHEEKVLAKVALDAAVAQANAQQTIITRTVTIKEKVPIYVTNNLACVSYGFVRVLDAAVHGVDPEALSLPPGQSNDSCTTLDSVAVAKSVAGNYGLAGQNAAQLDGLIAYDLEHDRVTGEGS